MTGVIVRLIKSWALTGALAPEYLVKIGLLKGVNYAEAMVVVPQVSGIVFSRQPH
jgi:hypothetical protein